MASGYRTTGTALALAIPFTLCADVIAEHRPEYEVFFRCQLAERLVYHQSYSVETFALAEKEVETIVAHGLDDVVYVLVLESCYGERLIPLVEGEKHHAAHPLLVLIDVVHQDLHIYRHRFFLLHSLYLYTDGLERKAGLHTGRSAL